MSDLEMTVARAQQALEQGGAEEAVRLLRGALKESPDNQDVQVLLGDALIEAGHLSEGVKVLEKLLASEPRDLDALFTLGDAYFELGQSTDACKVYEQILQVAPGEVDALVSLGLVHYHQNFHLVQHPVLHYLHLSCYYSLYVLLVLVFLYRQVSSKFL